MKADKLIVSNKRALAAKYGESALAEISSAVEAWVRADAERGWSTRWVGLDTTADVEPLGIEPVRRLLDPRQNKEALDAVYRATTPDYLVILGAPDVVPHQPLVNPVPDGDPHVDSDLPYACEASWSLDAESFKGPTRVVSRLPDLVGRQRDAAYLLALLASARDWVRHPPGTYADYFALSAEIWKSATRSSVASLFGTTRKLRLSPPEGPEWLEHALDAPAHLLNVHGLSDHPDFYGQQGETFPVAHAASHLAGRLRAGTVVAAECCYGAQLVAQPYDVEPGIAATYLGQGAYGVFGSTTISYGLAEGTGEADLLCRYFLREVLGGASLGRAALQARQSYVTRTAPLDPVDLKTLAQFCLLGDGSIHPTRPDPADTTRRAARAFAPRAARRDRLRRRGEVLGLRTASVASATDGRLDATVAGELRRLAADHELDFLTGIASFEIRTPPPSRRGVRAASRDARAGRYHLLSSRLPRGLRREASPADELRRRRSFLLAREEAGEIVEVRTAHPK